MGLSFSHRILQAINIILSSHWLQNNFQAPPNSPPITEGDILGDPGADKGGEGKSKRTEKYGTKESKERREEPLGTMSYQTSSNGRPRSGF